MKINKLSSLVVFASLSVFSAFSMAAPISNSNELQFNDSQNNSQTPNLTETQQKEGKAMKVLMLANMNEINAGRLAAQKSTNPSVKRYAQLMIKDHTQNLKMLKHFSQKTKIQPLDSETATNMIQKGKEEETALKEKSGKEFDEAYMSAMVKDHEEVLKAIDNDLLPNASNPEIVNHLKATRAKVAEHLKLAQDIQSKL